MTWHERIEQAKARRAAGLPKDEWFTTDDKNRAGDYVTCACGEQDPRIPRMADGQPLDAELAVTGAYFSGEVSICDIEEAERCLAQIEARAAEVLRGLEQ